VLLVNDDAPSGVNNPTPSLTNAQLSVLGINAGRRGLINGIRSVDLPWCDDHHDAIPFPTDFDQIVHDALPAVYANARTLYLSRLYYASAVLYAWIEATFPEAYQEPQIKALDKAFKALRPHESKLRYHINPMEDATRHEVVFESQSRANLEHTTTASGCTCDAGTQDKTCLHYPAGRILVLATVGIDPAGLLPMTEEVTA
jgi:hypothetical protein